MTPQKSLLLQIWHGEAADSGGMFYRYAAEDPATCSGLQCRITIIKYHADPIITCSAGRLAWSRKHKALSRVKSKEHELKQPYVGTDCVELTPVDMKTPMIEAGSPVACSGEEVTSTSQIWLSNGTR